MMQASLAGTGVWLSDGATNILPVGSDREAIHRAWRLHYDHIRHSPDNAFYQGWDLHPAQLPSRFAAVYAFFLEGLESSSERLRNFIAKAAQATSVGGVFDDANAHVADFERAPRREAGLAFVASRRDGRPVDSLERNAFELHLRNSVSWKLPWQSKSTFTFVASPVLPANVGHVMFPTMRSASKRVSVIVQLAASILFEYPLML